MDEEVNGTMSGSQERLKEEGTLKSQGDKSADEVDYTFSLLRLTILQG